MSELAWSLDDITDEERLLRAEQQVRSYCGWHIAPERTETMTLDGSGTNAMLLPTLHLTAVTAATDAGNTVDIDTLEWSAAGILRRWCAWTCKFRGVTVAVTHGFDEVPADVAGVVRDIAMRSKGNPGGLASQTAGPFSVGFNVDLLSTEMAVLNRYKLPPRS